jgi:hypothetical protein
MRSLVVLQSVLLLLMVVSPAPSDGQSFRPEPSTEMSRDGDYGPAREIKRFTGPTIQLRGSAEQIGLDSRVLASALEVKFLQDFAFLQGNFAFDKTYETWEIGLFD